MPLALFMVTLNRLADFWRLLARQVLRRVDHKQNMTQSSERQKPAFQVGQISPSATLRHLPDQPDRAARRALHAELIWLHQTVQCSHEKVWPGNDEEQDRCYFVSSSLCSASLSLTSSSESTASDSASSFRSAPSGSSNTSDRSSSSSSSTGSIS